MFFENVFPLNPLSHDPNARGEVPMVLEYHNDIALGTMTAGVVTKTVNSKFGNGLGTVYGVFPLTTKGAGDNESLAFTASAGSGAGEVDVLVHSSDATATDNNTVSFFLVGVIEPTNV